MLKMLRHGVSVVCLLAVLIVSIYWVRSFTVSEACLYRHGIHGPEFYAFSTGGFFVVGGRYDDPIAAPPGWVYQKMMTPTPNHYPTWEHDRIGADGIHFVGLGAGLFSNGFSLIIPAWMLLLILLAAPIIDFILWFRAKRLVSGQCPKCHYDLRASTATCPECGTPIDQPIAKLPA